MVESCFDNKRVKRQVEYTGVNYNSSEIQGSPIRRDPSFSRWCDEDGNVHFDRQLENSDGSVEGSDFELPFLPSDKLENGDVDTDRYQYKNKFQRRSVHLNDSNTMDQEINIHTMDHEVNIHTMDHEINIHNRGKDKENYVPFDIENGSPKEIRPSNSSDDTADSFGNHEKLPLKTKSPVSAADVLKTLFFILVWYTFSTFLTLLESPSFRLLGIILIISVGILLTVAKETEFEFWGFVLVMLAAVMSGFRWSMTQILLQKEEYGLKNPLTLMSFVTPVMAIVTALFSLMFDPWYEFRKSSYFDNSWHIARSCFLMFFGGTLAFFMVLTEYVLVSVTSAVTVTIAGVVKEAVTILVAVFYFHDKFTWLKGVGLLIIMVGVSLFNWYKYEKLQKRQMSEDDVAGSPMANVAAKYVILEEMDDDG
ncbi:hypothetical protein GH714_033748 [Hevea brasiliensis]|uniref:Sugar phosphate transporter domain-containing protein n=1 Tax=Hevea brasiliensis TaxID=3981 RepID=A0A6A6LLA9_HEVBR|nr:hypothetical protein GH714_033748 [Hevea brasiliensis]